jgi:hypothetical protein
MQLSETLRPVAGTKTPGFMRLFISTIFHQHFHIRKFRIRGHRFVTVSVVPGFAPVLRKAKVTAGKYSGWNLGNRMENSRVLSGWFMLAVIQ